MKASNKIGDLLIDYYYLITVDVHSMIFVLIQKFKMEFTFDTAPENMRKGSMDLV